jgi:alpha-aminoadipate carrier protein LysW
MPKTYCPECDAVITIDSPRDGARIKCPDCGVELEIVSSDPLDVFFPYDDDWDDDDYDHESDVS